MTASRPRALLVSWLFPPHGSIGAKRAYKFARHLPAYGWDATVLCGRRPPDGWIDPSPWSLPDGARVVADYDAAWLTSGLGKAYSWFRGSASAPAAKAGGGGAAGLRRSRWARIEAGLEQRVWDTLPTEVVAVHAPHAVRAARRIVREDGVSVLWTTSYPFSAHLVGLALKSDPGLPWVADLRDPWTLHFSHDAKPAPARWIERRLEARVFERADRVIVTTETLAGACRERYPSWAGKFSVIRNAFEPMDLPPRRLPGRPVALVHFGHVYGRRTLSGVYRALASLRSRGAFRSGDVVLENYGRMSDTDRAEAEALGLSDTVRALDPMPYVKGLSRLRSAHVLLLPAWGSRHGALFLPAKLYDYFLADAPILAVGDNPELAEILQRTSTGALVAADDVDGIARFLGAAIDGRLVHDPNAEAVAEFSAPRAAARLAAVFDAVTRFRPQGLLDEAPHG